METSARINREAMEKAAEDELLGEGRMNSWGVEAYWPKLLDDPYLPDYLVISKLLRGGRDNVRPGLQLLEKELQEEITHRLQSSGDNKRLLSTVLARAEDNAKFTPQMKQERRAPTLTRFQNAEEFKELLVDRTFSKDPGAGPRHGEFTHRIQWYIIYKTARLQNPAHQLLEKIAQYDRVTTEFSASALWDALFDRLYPAPRQADLAAQSPFDFRCPEFFNDWLTGEQKGEKEFPTLCGFLKRRKAKRQEQQKASEQAVKKVMADLKMSNEFDAKAIAADLEYLAQHYYKKSYKDLPDKAREAVRAARAKGKITDRQKLPTFED